MQSKRWLVGAVALLGVLALVGAASVRGAESKKEKDEGPPLPLVRQIYRVDDLLVRWDLDLVGAKLDGLLCPPYGWCPEELSLAGFMESPINKPICDYAKRKGPPSPEMAEGLIDIITRTVNHESDPKVSPWSDEGGPAAIQGLKSQVGWLFIITQTREGQAQVTALLDELRQASAVTGPMVTIHARWIVADEDKIAALLGRDGKRRVPMETTNADLEKAGAKTIGMAATTCFDGQVVGVGSGRLEPAISPVLPAAPPAEASAAESSGAWFFDGGLIEARPAVSKEKDSVLLDYRAVLAQTGDAVAVAGPKPAADKAKPAGAAATVPATAFQSLRGSVRIPLDRTVLLGCTKAPKLQDGKVVCLIVEVSAGK